MLENLEEKKTKLATVEEQIRILQEGYDKSVDEKLNLTRNIALTQTRLKRAGKLITALITEKSRWEVSKKVCVAVVLQWCCSGVAVVLQGCCSGVAGVLQWCCSGVAVVLQWCFSGVAVV